MPGASCPEAYEWTLSRVTFVGFDGAEYELQDVALDGRLVGAGGSPNCGQTTVNRGKIFKTADGTSATFISDADIYDLNVVPTMGETIRGLATGNLHLADGTTYRIEDSAVKWREDRTGNRINYTYQGNRLSQVSDSLGRVWDIIYTPEQYIDPVTGQTLDVRLRVIQRRGPGTGDDLVTRVAAGVHSSTRIFATTSTTIPRPPTRTSGPALPIKDPWI
jgi:hypothetical protein